MVKGEHDSVTNVPIVRPATAWQSLHADQKYITHWGLVVINPNQLRHFGTKVQDDPTSDRPLSIITEVNIFSMEVMMDGTVIYSLTTTPFEHELHNCPQDLSSTLTRYHFQRLNDPWVKKLDHYGYHNDLLFSINQITRNIARLSTLELVKSSIDTDY